MYCVKYLLLFAVLLFFQRCSVAPNDLYSKCKNEVLNDYFYKEAVEFIKTEFVSQKLDFKLHRNVESSMLKTNVAEPDKNLKKGRLHEFLTNIALDGGVYIHHVRKDKDAIVFYGRESCSFSIVLTSDIDNYLKGNKRNYKLFQNYDEGILETNLRAAFMLNEETYLLIDQDYP